MSVRSRRRLSLVATLVLALGLPAGFVLAGPMQFSDVPASHPFRADIDALVSSGVTSGCGGGKFCPSQSVTRGQMAAFLNRLGALAPDKDPVVNADRVDGIDSSGFARGARATLARSAPEGTRILLDSWTGADIRLANSDGLVRIVNGASSTMELSGIATYQTEPAEIQWVALNSGSFVSMSAAGTGPTYLDLMIVVRGASAASTRVSHLTCSSSGTSSLTGMISCIVTR